MVRRATVTGVLALVASGLAATGIVGGVAPAAAATQVFGYTGTINSFTVPANVFGLNYVVSGARGGTTGGLGATVSGTLAVSPGQILQLDVGGDGAHGGYNGGGLGGGNDGGVGNSGDTGGGASDIRVGTCASTLLCDPSARVVVAGGGGGNGGDGNGVDTGAGAGGSTAGASGHAGGNGGGGSYGGKGGGGAAGTSPGPGGGHGVPRDPFAGIGQPGNSGGVGGNGAGGSCCFTGGGGGGGGGWAGGGGGGGAASSGGGGGGGAGSSLVPKGATVAANTSTGDGQIVLTWVVAQNTTTAVAADPNPVTIGEPTTLTATVSPVPDGGTVQFTLDGSPIVPTVPVNTTTGQAQLVLRGFSSAATHSIAAVYSGDFAFVTSSGSATLVVTKIPTSTTVTSNPSSSAFGHPATFTASVASAAPSTNPTAQPTGSVVFSVDGTPVQTVALDSSQQASITTSALAPGSHTIEAAYQGDGNYEGSTGDLAGYLVTCSTTITGTHNGAVHATEDSTCIVNATVHGAVVVRPGASIAVIGSSVSGSITASNSPGRVLICGTSVGDSVTVIRAAALVIVGDPGDAGCAVNRIYGSLVLQNNTNGVEAIGNTVGKLVASGNSGPGPYPGDPTTISGNVITK